MVDMEICHVGPRISGELALVMVVALYAIAVALFILGACVVFAAWALGLTAKVIWEDLYPLLQYRLVMDRTTLRLEIEEAGFKLPDWLEDEEQPEAEIVHLVPKDTD